MTQREETVLKELYSTPEKKFLHDLTKAVILPMFKKCGQPNITHRNRSSPILSTARGAILIKLLVLEVSHCFQEPSRCHKRAYRLRRHFS